MNNVYDDLAWGFITGGIALFGVFIVTSLI